MYDFSERIVVVTGAAMGLGYAMSRRFLRDGAKGVALLDVKKDALSAACSQLDPKGERTLPVVCDVADNTSVEAAFTQVFERFGRVDILVNNAGITRDGYAAKMTAEQFDKVVSVSLNGAFYCTRQVIPGMRERAWGRIVSLSSVSAEGNAGQTNYSAAKAGIIGMSRTLSDELARKNITVNCIAPGFINTDIIKTIPKDQMEVFLNTIPAGRVGEPDEVAALVAFLASGEAAYISGACIKITGGLH